MFSISARLNADLAPDDLLLRCGLEQGGPVQCLIDQRVIDYCHPYVPASPNRTLDKSVQLATDVGSGRVIWDTPYARYQYHGVVYGPNIPILDPDTGVLMGYFSPPGKKKHPTDKKMQYDREQNRLAGAFWFERMKADRLNDILKEARNLAAKGMKK